MQSADAEAVRLAVGLLQERLQHVPVAGLRGTDLLVLSTIDALGPEAFPTAIGQRLQMRRSNVSVTVGELARRGLVESTNADDDADRRRRPMRLTERGEAALHHQQHLQDEWLVASGTEQFTAAEVQLLSRAVPLLLRLARS